VAGILFPEGLALVEGGRVALTDIATFQEFTGLYGLLDRIDLTFKPKTSRQDIDDLVRKLPEELELRSPSAARDSGTAMIRAYQLNLSVLSFASLFVGMFLVYSLVALKRGLAASGARHLAVRGRFPRELFMLFLSEGALFGVCGWLLAIPFEFAAGEVSPSGGQPDHLHSVRADSGGRPRAQSPGGRHQSRGDPLYGHVATFQPAREAMGVPPKEAMEISQAGIRRQRSVRRLAVWALACILVCIPLSLLPGVSGIPLPGYLAIVLLFIGFSLLAPWMLERLGRILAPLLRRFAGISAYLAGRYLRDCGARTAISVGALITAVALFTALVIMIYSFRHTVELWVRQTVSGDLFVTTKMGQVNRFRFPYRKPSWPS